MKSPVGEASSVRTDVGMLALVTDAFGGRGGIAQYNRDFLSSVAKGQLISLIEVIPRRSPSDGIDQMPPNIRQQRAPAGKLAYALAAIKTARRMKPRILFCGHLYMAPLARVAARAAGSKLIIQLHGIEMWQNPTQSQRKALEAADLILCVSRDTRRRVLVATAIDHDKVRVLPNTVAAAFYPGKEPKARSKFGIKDYQFVLLSVGRLDPAERYKGHDLVLNSLPKLLSINQHIHYLIAGEGADRQRLERLAATRGIVESVTFLGHVPPERLPELYRAADLFVLPSTGEGFGIVYLEAMACGTRAIGLAEAGARDALVDGKLGKAPSPTNFVHSLIDVINDSPACARTLSNKVQAHFGPAVFNTQVSHLIRCHFFA